MSSLFYEKVWPNYTRAVITPWGNYGGKPFFGTAKRRHDLVRQKLRETDCDLLMVENYFPPSTMGVHTSMYWLGCENSFKNTYTLILPQNGELLAVHGVKTSEVGWRLDPYSTGEDMAPALQGGKAHCLRRSGPAHPRLLQLPATGLPQRFAASATAPFAAH